MTGNAWQADLHPRRNDGKFTDKPGGGNSWAGKLSEAIGNDLGEIGNVESQNRRSVQEWWDSLTPAEKAKARSAIRGQANKAINVRVSLDGLRRLLAGGNLQTSHDTGHKGSGYDAFRRDFEDARGLQIPESGDQGDSTAE